MARRRKHEHHESEALLAWRRRQKPRAIMRPSTFEQIVKKTMARYGISRARAKQIAGAAYWRTAEARYRGRPKRHASHARTR